MIKLFVDDTNLHSPIAGIRWCVDKNTIDKLAELKIQEAYVLFVIAQDNDGVFKEVEQKIVPLKQAMEYIEFHRPGKHRIFACLVWNNPHGKQYTKSDLALYFSKQRMFNPYSGDFTVPSFNYPDHEFRSHPENFGYGSVDVVVPAGYFAKEPPAWEKWWVNLWYESKPKNQCYFRKRRFIAYSIQPPIVLGFILIKTFIALLQIIGLLLIGTRGIKFEALIHPFRYSTGDCAPEETSSIFITDSSGKKRNPVFFLFMPAVQLTILFLVGLLKLMFGRLIGLNMDDTLYWLLAIDLIIVVMVFAINWASVLKKLFPDETMEQSLAKQELKIKQIKNEYQDIVCTGNTLAPQISSLPARRQTVYLKFQQLKSKVCLPFAS
ncbi:MAG: hypothetical protein AAB784_00415 [Patescibacteria group bacterium]